MGAKTALIFGVSGQDGAYLAEFLIGKDYMVHGTTRRRPGEPIRNLDHLKIRDHVELHAVDALDCGAIGDAIDRSDPDECYVLWGQSSVGASFERPLDTFQSIALGTINILENLRTRDSSARVFYAGSSECFGATPRPVTADAPFDPKSPYALAKASAVWSVRTYREAYGLWACSGLLFNHESPLRDPRFVTRKIVSAAVRIANGEREKLRLGNLSIHRDWGWAPEFIEAFWLMLQQDKPRDYVIATGESNPLQEFVEKTFLELGLDWKEHVEYDPALVRPSDLDRSFADVRDMSRDLGWRAQVRMADIIERMVASEAGAETKSQ